MRRGPPALGLFNEVKQANLASAHRAIVKSAMSRFCLLYLRAGLRRLPLALCQVPAVRRRRCPLALAARNGTALTREDSPDSTWFKREILGPRKKPHHVVDSISKHKLACGAVRWRSAARTHSCYSAFGC